MTSDKNDAERRDKIRLMHLARAEWVVFTNEEANAVHVFPPNDWITHHVECGAADCECPCEPRIVWVNKDGVAFELQLIVHHPLDQREELEIDYDEM